MTDHKFAALHGAVWSGGSFIYVPEGVDVDIPLQSYFRLNAPGAGQFEHILIIVDRGAEVQFIEGCSAPKYSTITFAAEGQHLDTGAKVVHAAPYISSNINSKSIAKDGGRASYRGLLRFKTIRNYICV